MLMGENDSTFHLKIENSGGQEVAQGKDTPIIFQTMTYQQYQILPGCTIPQFDFCMGTICIDIDFFSPEIVFISVAAMLLIIVPQSM